MDFFTRENWLYLAEKTAVRKNEGSGVRRKIRTPLSRYTTRKVKWINAFMGDLNASLKKKIALRKSCNRTIVLFETKICTSDCFTDPVSLWRTNAEQRNASRVVMPISGRILTEYEFMFFLGRNLLRKASSRLYLYTQHCKRRT